MFNGLLEELYGRQTFNETASTEFHHQRGWRELFKQKDEYGSEHHWLLKVVID